MLWLVELAKYFWGASGRAQGGLGRTREDMRAVRTDIDLAQI
jgi:hypothetical protein